MIVEVFQSRLIATTCCFVLILGETAAKKPYPLNWSVFWSATNEGLPKSRFECLQRSCIEYSITSYWKNTFLASPSNTLKRQVILILSSKMILWWTLLQKSSMNCGHLLASTLRRCKSIGGRFRDSCSCWIVKYKFESNSDESSFVFFPSMSSSMNLSMGLLFWSKLYRCWWLDSGEKSTLSGNALLISVKFLFWLI